MHVLQDHPVGKHHSQESNPENERSVNVECCWYYASSAASKSAGSERRMWGQPETRDYGPNTFWRMKVMGVKSWQRRNNSSKQHNVAIFNNKIKRLHMQTQPPFCKPWQWTQQGSLYRVKGVSLNIQFPPIHTPLHNSHCVESIVSSKVSNDWANNDIVPSYG